MNSYENVTEEESSDETIGDHIIQPLKGQVSEVEKIVRAGNRLIQVFYIVLF